MSEKPKLLYVDDERANLIAFRALFSDSYLVLIAETAAEAYALLQEQEIPLIISDQRMPGMTGTQLLEKVATEFPECVRMILTGYADIEAVIEAVNRGRIYYYFKKPWNEAEVRLTLNNALESSMTRRQLIESEQRFRNTFEQAGLGIAHLDLEGRIVRVNSRLQGFLGLEEAGLIDTHLSAWFAELGQAELAAVVSGQDAALVRETAVPTQGGERWSRVTVSVSLDRRSQPCYLIALVDDLTERKKAEEEREKLQLQLNQSQKMEALGQLAGGVAHDFNNILSVIMGYGYMLKVGAMLDGRQQERVEQIIAAAERAAQLTKGLLAFSRKQELSPRIVNLNDVVQHLQKFLVRVIGEDIQLASIAHEEDIPVNIDSGQIEQALINLATNARDAMPKGGVLTIETGTQEVDAWFAAVHGYGHEGRFAVITVADTGIGMSEEVRKKIFEPFFTTKETGKGTGLGMAIVYGVVKQHNGFINLYSEPGKGTTFRIYLPLVQQGALATEAPVVPLPHRGGGETILVAEDEPSVRQLVAGILTNYGYEVLLAEDGQEAVDQFVAHGDRIALVLMDMIMPKLNGNLAADEIRRRQPGMRILFSSGYTADFIKNRGVEDEGIELIVKPVQPLELLRRIREMLDR